MFYTGFEVFRDGEVHAPLYPVGPVRVTTLASATSAIQEYGADVLSLCTMLYRASLPDSSLHASCLKPTS